MGIIEDIRQLPGDDTSLLGDPNCDTGWREVRAYKPTHEEGRAATVWVLRRPARFWRLTSGDIEITTGSGDEMGLLLDQIAQAIAGGMLGFRLGGRERDANPDNIA